MSDTTDLGSKPTDDRFGTGDSPSWELLQLWRQGQRPDVREFLLARDQNIERSELVATLRVDQRQRWQIGEFVRAEQYLAIYPALADDIESAVELVYGEYLLREETGGTPTLDEYAERFPSYAERLKLQLALRRAICSVHNGDESPQTSFWNQERHPPESDDSGVRESLDSHDRPTPRIDGYEMLSVVGRGGMGVVYKARQLGLNRLVAIKMVLSGENAAGDQLDRFRTEAKPAALLRHPNIVEILSVGEQDGCPYLVMEYVDGGTLAQRLDGTPQPPADAAELVRALARAIQFAHEHGVVHRDLKPANVLLAGDASQVAGGGLPPAHPHHASPDTRHASPTNPKITDFGLAKILSSAAAAQTQSGAILGTPSYMAPEQAQGGRVGPGCDIYALGAILYELLTGRPPFKAHTPLDTLHQLLTQEPISVSRLQPKVPRDLETICLKCLRKEPQRRYATATELADDLDRFLHDRPIQARRAGTFERVWRWCRRNRALAVLITSVALLLVTIAIGASVAAALWRNERDEAVRARNQIAEAERQKTDKLWESLLANERAVRHTSAAGRRFDGLRFLAEAAAIRSNTRLRGEAIACLALLDVRPIEPWHDTNAPSGQGIDADSALERYAINDLQGHVLVRRVADNRELHRLSDPAGVSFWHFWAAFSPTAL